MRILVAGSVAFDQFLRYDGSFLEGIDAGSLENLSMAFRVHEMTTRYGGTGAAAAWGRGRPSCSGASGAPASAPR